jgi:hypothetical protein
MKKNKKNIKIHDSKIFLHIPPQEENPLLCKTIILFLIKIKHQSF